MDKFIAKLGAALSAFAGETREVPATEVAQKGSAWPFNRVPLMDGGGAGDKLRKPFKDSVWVQRAIKTISTNISSVTLRFRCGDQEIEDAPWLSFWKKPVAGMTTGDFIEAMVGWLKLAGEDFILVPDEMTVPFPEARNAWPQLVLVRPDQMRAVKDGQGQLLCWDYSQSGQHLKLFPDQLIQIKYWNPYDAIRGMSEYESAHVASESDYLSGKFALNLARANGDTGVIVSVEGNAMPDDPQMEQIRNSLRLKAQKSRNGEFSSIFIPANLKIADPQIRTPDSDFVAQRLENRHEIYIAFGLPPGMADVTQSYSIGAASDRYRAIEDACIPTSCKIAEAISQIASRMAGMEVEAYFDWDEHPVMQQVRRERLDAWTKLFDRGVPGRIASDYLDLDLPDYPGADQGYIPFSLAPVGAEGLPPEKNPAFSETENADEEMKSAFKTLRSLRTAPATQSAIGHRPSAICSCGCSLDDAQMASPVAGCKARSEKDIKLWKSIIAPRRETIRAYASKFNKCLMVARAEVIGKLEKAAALEKSASVTRAVAADFLFNLDAFTKLFQVSMRGVAVNALQKAGDQVFAEIGKDDVWKMPSAQALKFLKDRQNKLANVPNEVFDSVRNVIVDGLQHGETLGSIADGVRAEFNDMSKGRAFVIANTETASAYGYGRHQAMRTAGVQFKRWLVSGNSNVRQAHLDMNGVIVGIDEMFVVTQTDESAKTTFGDVDEVEHPAGMSGEPWNVINCHCCEVASATGPDEENADE